MIKFTKMQGLGNDYVYMDAINQIIENPSELAKKISDRHFGIGSDGLILICKSDKADFKMKMFNKDGSEAEMCGNGIRCVGKFVYDNKLTNKTKIDIETLAGIKHLQLNTKEDKVETVIVDMGEPILEPNNMPVNSEKNDIKIQIEEKEFEITCVSMGNPHAIIKVEDIKNVEIEKYGKMIETHKIFPNNTNVEFIQIVNSTHVKMRVWERGAGETLACGTGACATAVACNLKYNTNNKITVELLGGDLQIEWNKQNNHIYMTGPAVTVFEGKIDNL